MNDDPPKVPRNVGEFTQGGAGRTTYDDSPAYSRGTNYSQYWVADCRYQWQESPARILKNNMVENILVVDDNPALTQVLEFNLGLAGYSVVVVASGEQAKSACHSRQFDLIITDDDMPGISGPDFCAQLAQQLPEYVDVPKILLTDIDNAIEQAQQRQFVAIFRKPFSPSAVVGKVGQLLAHRNVTLD